MSRNPIDGAVQRTVSAHHDRSFGDKPVVLRGLKLGEECGEVQGAIVRHLERRDDRSWLPDIVDELGDVVVVLLNICAKLDVSFSSVAEQGVANFLARDFGNIDPGAA